MGKVENRIVNCALFDIYCELLTKREKVIFQQYFFEDLSLGEIAKESNISRQAVLDNIQRAEQKMISFENKLKVYSNRIKVEEIKNLLNNDACKQEILKVVYEILEENN